MIWNLFSYPARISRVWIVHSTSSVPFSVGWLPGLSLLLSYWVFSLPIVDGNYLNLWLWKQGDTFASKILFTIHRSYQRIDCFDADTQRGCNITDRLPVSWTQVNWTQPLWQLHSILTKSSTLVSSFVGTTFWITEPFWPMLGAHSHWVQPFSSNARDIWNCFLLQVWPNTRPQWKFSSSLQWKKEFVLSQVQWT